MISRQQNRVSIVMPTYNRSHTLQRAIESCINQTFKPFEIIVIDDYSDRDHLMRTSLICRTWSDVRLIRNSGAKGAQAARNIGILAAQGDWIAFLDSDDYLLPTSIELRLEKVLRVQAQVVHSDCLVRRNHQIQKYGVPALEGRVYQQLLTRPGPLFPALLIQRLALLSVGLLDEQIIAYQEWDIAIRLARRNSYAYVADATFVYDCSGKDTISTDMTRDVSGYTQIIEKHKSEIIRLCGNKGLADHYLAIASRHKALKCKYQYAKYTIKAIRLKPVLIVRLGKRSLEIIMKMTSLCKGR